MARVRDLLDRFRPAGTPGAAAGAGVPVDRHVEAERELDAVFAALVEAGGESEQILDRAVQDADQVTAEAHTRATTILATARRRAEAERADAAVSATSDADAEAAGMMLDAERRAAAVRQRATELLPGYVRRAVDSLRELAPPDTGNPP